MDERIPRLNPRPIILYLIGSSVIYSLADPLHKTNEFRLFKCDHYYCFTGNYQLLNLSNNLQLFK